MTSYASIAHLTHELSLSAENVRALSACTHRKVVADRHWIEKLRSMLHVADRSVFDALCMLARGMVACDDTGTGGSVKFLVTLDVSTTPAMVRLKLLWSSIDAYFGISVDKNCGVGGGCFSTVLRNAVRYKFRQLLETVADVDRICATLLDNLLLSESFSLRPHDAAAIPECGLLWDLSAVILCRQEVSNAAACCDDFCSRYESCQERALLALDTISRMSTIAGQQVGSCQTPMIFLLSKNGEQEDAELCFRPSFGAWRNMRSRLCDASFERNLLCADTYKCPRTRLKISVLITMDNTNARAIRVCNSCSAIQWASDPASLSGSESLLQRLLRQECPAEVVASVDDDGMHRFDLDVDGLRRFCPSERLSVPCIDFILAAMNRAILGDALASGTHPKALCYGPAFAHMLTRPAWEQEHSHYTERLRTALMNHLPARDFRLILVICGDDGRSWTTVLVEFDAARITFTGNDVMVAQNVCRFVTDIVLTSDSPLASLRKTVDGEIWCVRSHITRSAVIDVNNSGVCALLEAEQWAKYGRDADYAIPNKAALLVARRRYADLTLEHLVLYVNLPELLDQFSSAASSQTARSHETLGLLVRHASSNHITRVVLPRQTSETDAVAALQSGEADLMEFLEKGDFIVSGLIHTHPTQICYLSGIDMHTAFEFQRIRPQLMASIVVAPNDYERPHAVFGLTPRGMAEIAACTRGAGAHDCHDTPSPGFEVYRDVLDAQVRSKEHVELHLEDLRSPCRRICAGGLDGFTSIADSQHGGGHVGELPLGGFPDSADSLRRRAGGGAADEVVRIAKKRRISSRVSDTSPIMPDTLTRAASHVKKRLISLDDLQFIAPADWSFVGVRHMMYYESEFSREALEERASSVVWCEELRSVFPVWRVKSRAGEKMQINGRDFVRWSGGHIFRTCNRAFVTRIYDALSCEPGKSVYELITLKLHGPVL